MMMIGSDDRGRVKIVLYGINSKMADVALTPLLLAAPHIQSSFAVLGFIQRGNFDTN